MHVFITLTAMILTAQLLILILIFDMYVKKQNKDYEDWNKVNYFTIYPPDSVTVSTMKHSISFSNVQEAKDFIKEVQKGIDCF